MNSEKIRIILASKSPRRKELLENAGFEIVIIPSEAEENIDVKDPAEMVKKLSYLKANSVYENIANKEGEIDSSYAINTGKTAESGITDKEDDTKSIIVLGADTVVYAGGMILGKPKNKEEAREMIKMLSGNVHSVFTGFTIVQADGKSVTDYSETKVYVYPMTDEEIEDYISSNEPYDKAGAYGIQGLFGKYVEKIDGDYNNVVGLPVSKIIYTLKEIM